MIRSNKPSEVSHDRQDIEQNQLVQHPTDGADVGGRWLPDGVLFNIFSFCLQNNKLVAETYTPACGVPVFFRSIAFVSSDFLDCVYRYIQRTPVHIFVGFDDNSLRRIAWACQNNLKLGYFKFYQKGRYAASICKYMLQSCDISELLMCDMRFYGWSPYEYAAIGLLESVAVQAGFPSDIFQQHDISSDGACSDLQLQRFFAEHVPAHASALKIMRLTFFEGALYLPVLSNSFSSLEELSLAIHFNQSVDLQEVSRSIEQLTKLKTLILHTNFAASFQIHSTSLEEIDTTDCNDGFFVDKCVCPSLKKFTCVSLDQSYYDDLTRNGVKPVIPFTEEELEVMTTEEGVEVEVGCRPFIGMSVPGTCIVKIRCEEGDEYGVEWDESDDVEQSDSDY